MKEVEVILRSQRKTCSNVYISRTAQRIFRKETNDYVVQCLKGRASFIRCPASSAFTMRIIHPVLHFEQQIIPRQHFSIEITVQVQSKATSQAKSQVHLFRETKSIFLFPKTRFPIAALEKVRRLW